MDAEVFPYLSLIPYFISALISLGIAGFAWQRRQVTGTKPFVVMVLSQALWTIGYICELINPVLPGKIFWDDVQFFASVIWPFSYIMFVMEFSGRQWRRPRLTWGLISIPFLLFSLLIITDSSHHLIRPESFLEPGVPFDNLVYKFSTTVIVIAVYAYGFIFAGIFLLVKSFIQAKNLYRKQIGLVLLGTMFPIVGTLLTFFDVTIIAQRDSTPLTFAISNIVIAWGLYRYGLFDIVPIARDLVVENMSDLVFVLDTQNRFVDINPATEEVIERRNGEVIGKPASKILVNWQHLLPLLDYDDELITDVEVVYEGDMYYFAVKVTPLYDNGGRLNGRLVVARDVTDMKLTEKRLQRYTGQLEDANQELRDLSVVKDEFVTNVSHELRTPLTNIKLYHDLLVRKPDRIDSYSGVLERETKRLETIIEDLLTLSRLDQNAGVIGFEETNLNQLVQQLVSDRKKLIKHLHIDVAVTQQEDLSIVMADASMITQVLSILITNSVNYTPEGGEILISTVDKQEQGERWVGFCVKDTGFGISEEDQAKLFTRFFRGEASRQQGNAGTGLGLAIAKEIIDRHDGKIEVESTGIPGGGTAVTVWLPIKTSAQSDRG